ncbi:MAG: hypothetical protein HY013_01115 [Candidatus Solibacter usitatus]|nr:hypothetical protein [Candidatus Solibacter usitatus]
MLPRLGWYWRLLIHRTDSEQEMADEMRFHIDARAEDLMRSGMPRAEAERRARIEFGGVEVYKERCRDARGLRILDDLGADLRYAGRTLAKSPAFSLTAILTLALGIGANTGLFTLINLQLLRPVPVQDPSSLYQVLGYNAKRMVFRAFSAREYLDISGQDGVFTHVIADSPVRAPAAKPHWLIRTWR